MLALPQPIPYAAGVRPVAAIVASAGPAQAGSAGLAEVMSAGPAQASSAPAGIKPHVGGKRPLAAPKRPLAGDVVGIDPGHNGRNWSDPSYINHLVWNGREMETCDTTGTETAGGYTEAQFNWNVARYLTADLQAQGAKVVLTRHNNYSVGPCINTRAEIIDKAHANVAVDIHADGGPPSGRGFTILEPVADSVNKKVITGSDSFARILRSQFVAQTGMPISNYDGTAGLQPRDDLAGLNLTTVPKVLIECGNMRNATDAKLLVARAFQQHAAAAIAAAITKFLRH
jgi:N-acetylmuramoyl-L-alanine amidase